MGVLSDFNSLTASEMFLCIQIYMCPSGVASRKVQSNVALLQQGTYPTAPHGATGLKPRGRSCDLTCIVNCIQIYGYSWSETEDR